MESAAGDTLHLVIDDGLSSSQLFSELQSLGFNTRLIAASAGAHGIESLLDGEFNNQSFDAISLYQHGANGALIFGDQKITD
ncbi:MAG: hypothetical protein ACKOCM_00805 [Cyanobacteriota bacterium]